MNNRFTQQEKDIIIAAILIHDGKKHGESESQYTVSRHPAIVADWLQADPELNAMLPKDIVALLAGAVKSHMGSWNTDYKTKKVILPKPATPLQEFVHLCDYLASRKYLEFDFGSSYYNPDDYKDASEDELKATIDDIIALCKKKINEESIDRENIYSVIAEVNDGKKNPNSIADVDTARTVKKNLEVL